MACRPETCLQSVAKILHRVGSVADLILDYDIMGRFGGSLKTGVSLKIKVECKRMSDSSIDDRSSRKVTRSVSLALVRSEESHRVLKISSVLAEVPAATTYSFGTNDEGEFRLVVWEFGCGLLDRLGLHGNTVPVLTFGNTISEHDDLLRQHSGRRLILEEMRVHHIGKVLDNLAVSSECV